MMRGAANAFSPHVAAAQGCPSFLAYEDLPQWIQVAVQRDLKQKQAASSPCQARFVLGREEYEKLKQTIAKVHLEAFEAEKNKDVKKPKYNKLTSYIEPFLVYHSTQNVEKVNSVLKHGYLMPGERHPTELWTLHMAHGNRLGDGIYCSNHFDVTQWYSFIDKTRMIQLIVNILVPGRVGRVIADKHINISGTHQPNNGSYILMDRSHHYDEVATGIHTLWAPGMGQWVVGASERLIPVAVVNFPFQDDLYPLPELNGRLKYIRGIQVRDGATVTFSHVHENVWMVRPAQDPRLRPYLDAEGGLSQYRTVFALLATCLHQQFFVPRPKEKIHTNKKDCDPEETNNNQTTLQDYVEIYNEHMPSPSNFLHLYEEDRAGTRKRVQALERIFGPRGQETDHWHCMVRVCDTLVNDHSGQVPVSTPLGSVRSLKSLPRQAADDFLHLARISPSFEQYVQPFYNETNLDRNTANLFIDHYYILPPSLMGQSELIQPLQDYIGGWRSTLLARQFVTVTKSKAKSLDCVDVTKDTEALRRLHLDYRDAAASNQSDYLVDSLSHLLDRITSGDEEGREHAINIIYLFVRAAPQDMENWKQVAEMWAKYLPHQKVMVKLLVWKGTGAKQGQPSPLSDICTIKFYMQTLASTSPNYFWEVQNTTECEECFQVWGDEIDHEVVRYKIETVRFAVSYPFGIAGEGFLPDRPGSVGFQPEWERNVFYGQPIMFKGEKPPYVTQNGEYYPVSQQDIEGTKDLLDLSDAILCILSNYQGFIFASPERLRIYRYEVEKLARSLLSFVDGMSRKESPSLLKGIRYKLFGFLSRIDAFGGVAFTGKWYTNLRSMKFGKQMTRRVKKTFDLKKLERLVPFSDQARIKEPSDVLNFVSRKGRLLRVRTSGASKIEPWLVHIDYVSPDMDASTTDMFQAAESGTKVRDSEGHVVTDVLMDSVVGDLAGDEVAKLYMGFVFARTPYLFMASQYPALLMNALSCCVEGAFSACIKFLHQDNSRSDGLEGKDGDSEMRRTVREKLSIAVSMIARVREQADVTQSHELLENLEGRENVEELLTTKNMIQSVNQVLAALLLPHAANLVTMERWPRICFGILAEAVSRNCRAQVRSGKRSALELIDRALFLGNVSPPVDFKVNIKKSSCSTNHFMAHSFTNCSPFKAVGFLFFVQFVHKQMSLDDMVDSFVGGEFEMGRFLRDNLPGCGGYVTQLALYLRGMHYEANQHQERRPFANPRGIVDAILSERLDHYRIVRARATRNNNRVEHRRNVRLAEAEPYRRYHTVPRLFTRDEVRELNASRPIDDQLRVLPHGLLVHHCCYPDCPDFLRNFETENDKKSGRRQGLFAHLRHSRLLGKLHSGFFRNMHALISARTAKERVLIETRRLYPKIPAEEVEFYYNLIDCYCRHQ